MTPAHDRSAVRHVEIFVSRRAGVNVLVPCWCFIGEDHRYDAWLGTATGELREPGGGRTTSSTPSGPTSPAP